jgi:dihydroorotase
MDMPNTVPQTTSVNLLEWKLQRAASTSVANYSFFPGVTGDNAGEICKADPRRVPGVKVFLGSSTGGMLVDRLEALERIFGQTDLPVVVHAEKEEIIRRQAAHYMALYGDDPDVSLHPLVRSAEACYASSAEAVGMASRLGARLHILHLSTARELSLLDGRLPAAERRITAEACVHYLWFSDEDYALMGSRIKCNPSIKAASDRDALRQAVGSGLIDVVATDHAPHLLSEKGGGCFRAASGLPVVQHSLTVMLELASRGFFPPERVVEVMAHRPADLFGIDRRGYVRPGYFADLVLVDPAAAWTVTAGNVLYKCGWSPFEGVRFGHKVWKTFVNGRLVYDDGLIDDSVKGMEVAYVR